MSFIPLNANIIKEMYRKAEQIAGPGNDKKWCANHCGLGVKMTRQFALGMAIGLALGATAFHALHARTTPLYYVAEVDVTNPERYIKEFVPKAATSAEVYGGRALAAGSKIIVIEGSPPRNRVVIMGWESLEQLQAWRESGQYKNARKLGDQYAASVRAFAIEGLP
jgi:uncharacterized protein (DUF1330 family)